MRLIFLTTFFFALSLVTLLAQIDPEYLLELKKGTTIEMNAITPVKGVLLYNTDDDKVYRFDGTVWLAVGEDGDWTRTGNNQYSAVSGNVGIGTTNPQRLLHLSQDSPSGLTMLALENSNATNGNSSIVSFRTKTTGAGATDFLETAAITATYEEHDHANQATDLTLWAKEGNTWSNAILKANGDFGIGTIDPKVHLNNNTSSITANLEISTTGKTGVDGRTDLSLFSDLDGSNPANIFLQGKLSNGKYGWATWSFRGNHSLAEYKDWVDFGLNDGTATKEQIMRMNVLNGDVVFNEGNVGIGYMTPTEKLDVQGNVAHSGSFFSRGPNYTYKWMSFDESVWGNSLVLGSGGTTILGAGEFSQAAKPQFPVGGETLVLGSDYNISFYTNTQNGWVDKIHAMQIIANGNVGIGTTAPGGNLHVSAGESGDAKLIIEADTDNTDENDNPMLIFKQDGGIEESAIVQEHNGLHLKNSISSEGGIVFDIGNVNGYENATEVMRVASNSNVGIKTDSPRSDLDVNGVLIEGNSVSSFGNASNHGSCVVSHGIASFFTNVSNTNYMHIKLPYKVDTHAAMYHIRATGYRYRSGKAIDITWVGYCYSPSNSLLESTNTNAGSPEFKISQYVGSDNHIYLRFNGTTGTNYYQSFRIDSMNVGNGTVLKEGDVEIISSASATL